MAITPDTKNWTWVLTKVCPECGSTYPAEKAAAGLRANVAEWAELLGNGLARERPTADVWSALEYGCHVRDVFRVFNSRLVRMLSEDDPLFANWDQDQTALDERYDKQDPAIVLGELQAGGERLAAAFDTVGAGAWQRSGRRSDGSRFTVDTLARYLLHDPVHHVWDVRRGLESLHRG